MVPTGIGHPLFSYSLSVTATVINDDRDQDR